MNPWIEAIRPRTLPASIAGVIAGCACAVFYKSFSCLPAVCCMLFALGAQIASNFANEYFDFKNGLDKKGREGFRRGVTEGDISPRAMRNATFATLLLSAIPGVTLIIWGGWWLLAVGIIIAVFALAYSTGPYPLSHHGLGDIAVVIFFGIVPVTFTAWLQTLDTSVLLIAIPIGLGTGLLAANILIVNNYRDADDDAAVGKHTTVVIFGRKFASRLYLANAITGILLLCSPAILFSPWWAAEIIMTIPAVRIWRRLSTLKGSALNNVLRQTAVMLLASCLMLLAESIIYLIGIA